VREGKVRVKREEVERSSRTVFGLTGSLSRWGVGVKLKSPTRQRSGRVWREVGSEARKVALSLAEVQGQYVLARVKACPPQVSFARIRRPAVSGQGMRVAVRRVERRTRIATPLLRPGSEELEDQREV
jgi:hypothetical protein